MNTISKILVPYDYSTSADKALDYAVQFVADEKININLIHVSNNADNDKMRDTYESLSKKYENKLKIPMTWSLGWDGPVTDVIMEAQEEKKSDLIIMGTSGWSLNKDVSLTSKLVKESKYPILVVPEDTKKQEIKNISLVLGKNEIDKPTALKTLLSISQKFNAKVHVLTIQNEPGTFGYTESDEKNENTLMYYLENFYSEHTFIENPDIVEGIFSYVNEHDIDMIAILPRNHTKKAIPSDGLLTKELVLKATVPVLTIE
ncbi:nucleotide-binding universal stress UspA family protein [Maribacter vaceletii]|uniref:Nucleotide-binding universal stress UspA family protein n=1 Tax=Maribacter vaceletii TaxID=1206816 RepID=A0A495DTU9_9FLAO|nr:universal stress protein [Maribacter vaceletii]RKR08042.1 nucleotide-binding universal stress UspA family protein [Maribacter vaceletii]